MSLTTLSEKRLKEHLYDLIQKKVYHEITGGKGLLYT